MKDIEKLAKRLQDKTLKAFSKLESCFNEINELMPTYEDNPIFILDQPSDGLVFCWGNIGNNTPIEANLLENLMEIKIKQDANPDINFDAEIFNLLDTGSI